MATAASLNRPNEVAVDNAGNIYIADTWNSRIRKVSTSGIITTVAGENHDECYLDGYLDKDEKENVLVIHGE